MIKQFGWSDICYTSLEEYNTLTHNQMLCLIGVDIYHLCLIWLSSETVGLKKGCTGNGTYAAMHRHFLKLE